MTTVSKKSSIKTGLAKISGGAQLWGIPDTGFTSLSTTTPTVNFVRYIPIVLRHPVTFTAFQFEVTAGPASGANARVGLYAADSDLQPTGTVIYDSGAIAVATSFTGVKTTTGLSIPLAAGTYLVAFNIDVAFTMRTLLSPSPTVVAAMGTNGISLRTEVAQTFGAFPSTGTLWTSAPGSTGGISNQVVWQWTE